MAQGETEFCVLRAPLYVAAPALFASMLGYNWLAARAKGRELRKLTLPSESRIRRCTLIDQPRARRSGPTL